MKKLNIHDIKNTYYIDEITCFEHPVAIAMNYYGRQYYLVYILMAKMYGIYMLEKTEKVREKIFRNLYELLGVEKVEYSKITWKSIKDNIDNGNPVIVGVNLKHLFYSGHYLKGDWGHWILVTGYDEQNKTLNIVDNAQYSHLGEKYGEFIITYDLVCIAAKSYRRKFGEKNVCIAFSKGKDISDKAFIIDVLQKYLTLEFSNQGIYRQIILLKELNSMYENEEDYANYYKEEFKKKIININKYRKVFFLEIVETMTENHYYEKQIALFNNILLTLYDKWEEYILINLVKASRGRFSGQEIQEIETAEKAVSEGVKQYINYLSGDGNKKTNANNAEINEITYDLLNNDDGIIYGNNDEIIFSFKGNRLYNWWIEDEAPKVCLYTCNTIENGKSISICVNIEINRNSSSDYAELLQAGIYLHTYADNKNYMCGIEGKERWALDRVGCDGKYRFANNLYNVEVCVCEDKIIFKYKNQNETEFRIIEQDINANEGITIGLCCKTWNKPGEVKVYFTDVRINRRNITEKY